MKDRENVLRQLDEADNMIMVLDQSVERGMAIDPRDGLLVLFPSYLMHYQSLYKGSQDRIVIGFNCVVHECLSLKD